MIPEELGNILGSSSSGNGEYAFEDDAEKLTADTTYYNGFLALSYTIPGGWWQYNISAENFTANPADSATETLLDISFGDDYTYIDIAYFANVQYSSSDNHIGVHISAEKQDGAETLDAYMEGYVEYMLEPYEGDTYTLKDEDTAEIHGHHFELRVFDVEQEGRPYCIITYTCAVNNGYYLTFLASYWPENKNAPENIRRFIEEGLEFVYV
jgi:hypothetical protein